jgi:hypothetical protein
MNTSACVNSCTYELSFEEECLEVYQYYKHCKTCLIDLSFSVVCVSCATICHDKHDLSELQYGNVVCDCGKMQLCNIGKFRQTQVEATSLASMFTSFGRKRKASYSQQGIETIQETAKKTKRATASPTDQLCHNLSLHSEIDDEVCSGNDEEYDYSDEEEEEVEQVNVEYELVSNGAETENNPKDIYISDEESSVEISSLSSNYAVTSVEN